MVKIYTLIDWVIDSGNVDYGGILANRQNLASGLQGLGDKRVNGFMKNSPDFFAAESDATGRSFNKEIDKNNTSWEDRITTQVTNAATQDDIGQIQSDIDDEKGLYESDVVDRVQGAINDKLSGVRLPETETERRREETSLVDDFKSASDQDETPALPSRRELDKEFGKTIADSIRDARDTANERFETLDDRVRSEVSAEIAAAASIDDLGGIDVSRAHTFGTEAELRDLLDNKRNELGG